MIISELSPVFRKAIERSIDTTLEDPEKFVRVLKKTEIELTDEAIMALLLGFIFNLANRNKQFLAQLPMPSIEEEEMTKEEREELYEIVKNRRPDILDAFRGYLE